ncbi:probable MGM101-mitochondrial genome maintenance protein [Fusarium mangiferae]|uniref:Mitochondrial genome maintenance protein MGM101 n=1 Tax=Fusarium mangiferae TaxID=192010 RepID=A0A1L7T2R5_FUSMA|nr:putative MGM101-mitochondrial genome maintenance protein [Fusarium mangiferae]CVK90453.1 probable MGM101-mitochondrial genome maintenance protein [Fusarium mangiferae]
MFVPRRALFAARRLPTTFRPIARYATEASDVTLQKPDQDVTQVKQEDVVTKPKYTTRAKAAPSTASAKSPTVRSTPAAASAKSTYAPKTFPPKPTASSKSAKPESPHKPVTVSKSILSETSETDTENTEHINWETSWYGLGVKAVTPEQSEILARPVDAEDVEVKPDGIIYLPEVKYRRRLNEAFGPMAWGMVHRGEVVIGNQIVTREYALIVNGRIVSQSQGYNNYFSPESIPAAIEGAKSNALMRCCKDLGIASELWDPVYIRWFKKHYIEEKWVEHTVTKKKRTFFYKKGLADATYPYKFC